MLSCEFVVIHQDMMTIDVTLSKSESFPNLEVLHRS